MPVPVEWYKWVPDQITAEDYERLPEDFCRSIEVIDGHMVKCESPSRVHNRVAYNLTTAFKAGRKPEPCLMVEGDIDVRFSDVPLSFRRPDVVVYRCIPDHERLYSKDTLLVVEIISPESSFKTDTVEKKAAYADAGIPVYLIAFLNAAQDGVEKIEEYWLSPSGTYQLVQLHTRRLTMANPVPLDIGFAQLTQP
ncbi:Uma2 family endonuclease [Actinomadura fibrosa]|uniref:Uma2 family endonuclease n=1 Tax=Actinomadura fibrosa TaxID=111802 RepID=A0ABW2XFD7_9ACTN|nr:Uma2 family endonuclease [Actinomadura fibrosa]